MGLVDDNKNKEKEAPQESDGEGGAPRAGSMNTSDDSSFYTTDQDDDNEDESTLHLGPQRTLKEQLEKDKDDESLRKWKEQLLGSVDINNIGETLDPEVKFLSVAIVSPERWEFRAKMAREKSGKDNAHALFHSLRSAYAATPVNLKIIDLYVGFAVFTALTQVVYMASVGSFPFNSFLSGVLSCVGTAVLAVCLRIQVNKENKEFKDLPPERAFADFVLCNLVLHLVIMNFLG